VYILYSKELDRYYVGSTSNLQERLNPDYALENLLQLESAAKYTVTLHF